MISASAPTKYAAHAESVSLSPNLISEVATESFSLMMGTAPSLSEASSAFFAFTYRSLSCTSDAVRRSCATGKGC